MKLVFNVDSDGVLDLVVQKRIQPVNFNIPKFYHMPRFEITEYEAENIQRWR